MEPIDRMTYLRQLMARGAPAVKPDATARPTSKEGGVKSALRAALAKLTEWDTKVGRDLAGRMPEGTSLQQGTVPDWIGGPKGVASGLKRAAPFDAAHALEMGKVRALESVPHEAPDLLPAMARAGRPITPTETPAFKSWFEASKVTDDAGSPLRVFHGTDSGKIKKFDRAVNWFTDDAAAASNYADRSAFTHLPEKELKRTFGNDDFWEGMPDVDEIGASEIRGAVRGGKKQQVYPTYVKMERPFDMTELGTSPDPEDVFEFLQKKGVIEADVEFADAANDLTVDNPVLWKILEDWGIDRDLKALGYDGMILDDISPTGSSHKAFATFEPTQVKSAIGNRGTFNPKDPRITYGLLGALGLNAYGKKDK